MARELEGLSERLEEANNQTQCQIEINKRREAELNKLQRDFEEHNISHESVLAGMRKKHADSTAELSEQIDNLQRVKQKLEKEKSEMKMEIDDLMATVETLAKSKSSYEKQGRVLEEQFSDVKSRYEDREKEISEAQALKARQMTEINELKRTLEEKDTISNQLVRSKNSINQSNEEIRRALEDESKAKNVLQHQVILIKFCIYISRSFTLHDKIITG